MTQLITPAIRQWIVEQAQSGCTPESVLQAMKASGWEEEVALQAMEDTLRTFASEASAVPAIMAEGRSWVDAGDRRVQILATMARPRAVVLGGVLSETECDALIDLSRPRLARSETVREGDGKGEVHADRTSQGMFFTRGETALISRIEARLAMLLRWPVDHGEGLQILNYRPGAEYKAHYDYFNPEAPGAAAVLKRGGQRVGTLVMYLNTPLAGGATTFPDVGFEVAPIKGNAIFFSYDRAHPSTGTLHSGAPVTEGEKWVATKWLRQGVFV